MTIILEQQPPAGNHLIVKKAIQRGDRVIFQWEGPNSEGAPDRHEQEVNITNVQTEPGLMKGYCVAGWEDPRITDLQNRLGDALSAKHSLPPQGL